MNKAVKKEYGFTLVELGVVIGILVIILSFSGSILARRQPLMQLETVSLEMLSVLRQAQDNSWTRKASSSWGVYFSEDNNSIYTMYAGNSYISRNDLYDTVVDIGDKLNWSLNNGPHDIVFSSINGFPAVATRIEIKHQNFDNIKIIAINELGNIERSE